MDFLVFCVGAYGEGGKEEEITIMNMINANITFSYNSKEIYKLMQQFKNTINDKVNFFFWKCMD